MTITVARPREDPSATLCFGILREMKTKGKDARFQKTERGKFVASD
jgi:hypothetical protein